MSYANVPPLCGAVISLKLATYRECATVLGMEAIYDMLEIANVDAHNNEKMRKDADSH